MRYRTLLLPCLLACSMPVVADVHYSESYTTCMDKSEGITVNMNNCNYAELKHQDARLNTQYQRAMASLSAEKK